MNWKWLVTGLILVVVVVLLALYLGGCFSSESSSGPPPPPPPAAAPPPPPPEAESDKTVEVTMENLQYMPHEVTVPRDGTVEWKNTDTPPHTVTKTDGPGEEFDSGTLQPDATFKQKFERRGRVDYECTIHPGQTGVVNVK
jgi:plastocyanin